MHNHRDNTPAVPRVELELGREQAEPAGIKDLPKLVVLWELWRYAKPNMAVVNDDIKINSVIDLAERLKTDAESKTELSDFFTFVWVDGRNLSVSLGGDFVDLALYNQNNQISGVALINQLKKNLDQICSNHNFSIEQASTFYLLNTGGEICPEVERHPKSKGMSLLDQILFGE